MLLDSSIGSDYHPEFRFRLESPRPELKRRIVCRVLTPRLFWAALAPYRDHRMGSGGPKSYSEHNADELWRSPPSVLDAERFTSRGACRGGCHLEILVQFSVPSHSPYLSVQVVVGECASPDETPRKPVWSPQRVMGNVGCSPKRKREPHISPNIFVIFGVS